MTGREHVWWREEWRWTRTKSGSRYRRGTWRRLWTRSRRCSDWVVTDGRTMHHSGGTGYGTGPQERVHQAPRTTAQPDKCPYETYQAQIPDCCAAAAAVQDPYPRPPSGYDGRCYDECHRRTPYQEDTYPQVRDRNFIFLTFFRAFLKS